MPRKSSNQTLFAAEGRTLPPTSSGARCSRVSGFVASFLIFAFCFMLCCADEVMAQRGTVSSQDASNAQSADGSRRGNIRDFYAPGAFTTQDGARRNRPPVPTARPAKINYPEGFLELSSASPEPRPVQQTTMRPSEPAQPQDKSAGTVKEPETPEVPVRPLDPSIETTPLSVEPRDSLPLDNSARLTRERFAFFAFSVALAGLGVFLYSEYRYRCQLREDLVRNARLCSPGATAADFAEIIAEDSDLVDPRAPSYIEPHYDSDVVLYGDPDHAGRYLNDPAFEGDRFEVSDVPAARTGPDLSEENFDFTPTGVVVEAPTEQFDEFVVGESTPIVIGSGSDE